MKPESWDQFVMGSENGTIFSRYEILKEIAKERNGKLLLLGVKKNDTLIAGLPLVVFRKHLLKVAVSVPSMLACYGGVIYDLSESRSVKRQENDNEQTIALFIRHFKQQKYKYVRLHLTNSVQDIRKFIHEGFRYKLAYTYYSAIRSIEEMWDHLDNEVRKNIKKCEKEGYRLCTNEEILALHQLVRDTYHRKGLAYREKDETAGKIYEYVIATEQGKLFLLKDGKNKIVAGRMMLWDNKRAYDWLAGTDRAHVKSGVNSYLAWECLKEASKQDKKEYDWCGADVAVVSRFKAAFNPELVHGFVLNKNNLLKW